VEKKIRDQLIDLNRTFYQTFAKEFSATRQRLQPGVTRILDSIMNSAAVLELGCGNGQFGMALFRKGHQGAYTGLDSNPELLEIATQNLPQGNNITLLREDLTSVSWQDNLPASEYNLVLAFAVLHHIPGFELRSRLISNIHSLLPRGGRFIHSEWQFLNSPRLRSRIQPWESIGLSAQQVEDGDFLIDWRSGGRGLRYVHLFDESELVQIAASNGFNILESYFSDGEGGNLAIYQIWESV
jgi:SAM-dependent methyltransferase